MNNFLKTHKTILIIIAFIFAFGAVWLLASFSNKTNTQLPQPSPQETKPFTVINTSPSDGSTGVYPGEIEIYFTTDTPVMNEESFSIIFNPPLGYGKILRSNFPTQQITYQVIGGLQRNTPYSITVTNQIGQAFSWSFTTSDQQQESATQQVMEELDDIYKTYYPLFDFIPYSNDNFSIDYTNRLNLEVIIKKQNTEEIEQEVEAWIREKGVDPTTHTINYIERF